MRPCAVRRSFLAGLQRLVLPGRPSHPHFCFFFNIHSFFLQTRLESSPLLLPGTGSFLLPSLSRRGCRRSEKGSGNMSLQRAKFSVFKVFEIACPPSWCKAKTRSEFAHSIGLDCQEPARCQRQNPCLPYCNVVQSPSPRPTAGPGPRLSLAITACSREAIYQCVREGSGEVGRRGGERRKKHRQRQLMR